MATTQTRPYGVDVSAFGAIAAEVERVLQGVASALEDRRSLAAVCRDLAKIRAVLEVADVAVIARVVQEIESLAGGVARESAPIADHALGVCREALKAVRRAVSELASGSQSASLDAVLHELLITSGHDRLAAAQASFKPDLSRLPPARDAADVTAAAPETLRAARARFQKALLSWIRDADQRAPVALREVVEDIEASLEDAAARAPWWIASGFFEVLAEGGVEPVAQARRLCAALDLHLRNILDGAAAAPETLMREMLYFIAVSPSTSERVTAVRRTYLEEASSPAINATAIGAALAEERWDALKRSCETALHGTAQQWGEFQSALLHAARSTPGEAGVAGVFEQLHAAAAGMHDQTGRIRETLAAEMATALLFVEDACASMAAGTSAPDPAQVEAMVRRLQAARSGEIDHTAQRVNLQGRVAQQAREQAAINSVAGEVFAVLTAASLGLESFFADRTAYAALDAADHALRLAHGVLKVMAESQAAAAAGYCRDQIARFRAGTSTDSEKDFAQVASVLSGLTYYVEQVRFGETDFAAIMRKAGALDCIGGEPMQITHPEAAPGEVFDITEAMALELSPLLHNENEQPLAAPLEPLESLDALEPSEPIAPLEPTDLLHPLEPLQPPEPLELLEPLEPLQPAQQSLLSAVWDQPADAGLLGIFLDEALEVLGAVRDGLSKLTDAPADTAALATIRRSFHTLKGSGRMVGLDALSEAASEVEQVMNGVMESALPASNDLNALLNLACEQFESWIAELQRAGKARIDAQTLSLSAACFKRGLPLCLPAPARPAFETEPAVQLQGGTGSPQLLPTADQGVTQTVEIGAVRISGALYASFMQEARQLVSGLRSELDGMKARVESRAASHDLLRFAHTLSGIAGTVRINAIQQLAGAMEDVAELLHREALDTSLEDEALFDESLAALQMMIDSVAACAQPQARDDLAGELKSLAQRLAVQLDAAVTQAQRSGETAFSLGDGLAAAAEVSILPDAANALEAPRGLDRRRARLQDDIDLNLLPVFLEEAADLAPRIGQELRDWRAHPAERQLPQSIARLLHTFKGSARMAGAMGLGELTHSMEARVSVVAQLGSIPESVFDGLEHSFDRIGVLLERLSRLQDANPDSDAADNTAQTDRSFSLSLDTRGMIASGDIRQALRDGTAGPASQPAQAGAAPPAHPARAPLLLRVRAERVEQLVAGAGEVAIARSRLDGEVRAMRGTMRDISVNLVRLRALSRELEIQAQSQMQSSMVQHKGADDALDPLEFDRYTRLQELTRFIAESAGDVATLQQNIGRNLDNCETALEAQARMTRALQDGLMSVRMIPFASLNERLFRVVRLTARESAKRVKLDIRGDKVELDRGVIERIIGPLEHLLRNAVVHGIETTQHRLTAGKPAAGEITLEVRQEGNEVSLILRDDGRGLDIAALRAKAIAAGLIKTDLLLADSQIVQFAFASGVSTADNVTESAGRGVGLDVVRSEVGALGGRVEVSFEPDKGTTFSIHLPLMVAVMHVLLVRCGGQQFALPTLMVSQVRAVAPHSLARLYDVGRVDWRGEAFPVHDLRVLLGMEARQERQVQRHTPLILIRGGMQRLAVQVDEIVGHEEVVVKNIGTQVARVSGMTGAAVRGGGEIVLILDPVQLTRRAPVHRLAPPPSGNNTSEAAPVAVVTVLVVDDSATVRKVTNRILTRQGYSVIEARDGVEALEKLRAAVPSVILLDVEMPRMDGFELLRRLREEPAQRDIPVIMITSRTAEKHRKMAMDLGANVFLGKPFEEQDLLAQVARVTVKGSG